MRGAETARRLTPGGSVAVAGVRLTVVDVDGRLLRRGRRRRDGGADHPARRPGRPASEPGGSAAGRRSAGRPPGAGARRGHRPARLPPRRGRDAVRLVPPEPAADPRGDRQRLDCRRRRQPDGRRGQQGRVLGGADPRDPPPHHAGRPADRRRGQRRDRRDATLPADLRTAPRPGVRLVRPAPRPRGGRDRRLDHRRRRQGDRLGPGPRGRGRRHPGGRPRDAGRRQLPHHPRARPDLRADGRRVAAAPGDPAPRRDRRPARHRLHDARRRGRGSDHRDAGHRTCPDAPPPRLADRHARQLRAAGPHLPARGPPPRPFSPRRPHRGGRGARPAGRPSARRRLLRDRGRRRRDGAPAGA